jgi:hypothetical protein
MGCAVILSCQRCAARKVAKVNRRRGDGEKKERRRKFTTKIPSQEEEEGLRRKGGAKKEVAPTFARLLAHNLLFFVPSW